MASTSRACSSIATAASSVALVFLTATESKFFGDLAVDHHDEIERVLVVRHLGDDVDQLTLGLEMTLGAVIAVADRVPHLLENGFHAGDVAVGARLRRIRRGLDDDAVAQAQQLQQLLALLEALRADPKSRPFLRLGDEGADTDAALDDAVVFELRDRLSHHRPRHAELGRQRLFGRQAIAGPKLAGVQGAGQAGDNLLRQRRGSLEGFELHLIGPVQMAAPR